MLGEFGDDRTRFTDARARKNYAGTSPTTKASGTRRVVLARFARNEHLFDAYYRCAFCSLTASPGARACYDAQRAKGRTARPSGLSPTVSWASSMDAYVIARPTEKRWRGDRP